MDAMGPDGEYLLYQPPPPQLGGVGSSAESEQVGGPVPLSDGLWQEETLSVLQMYSDQAQFTPVLAG